MANDPAVIRASDLLAQVVDQDVTEGDDGEATIRQGVAPDRVVSHSDPEMHHGRKSASRRFDGHKLDVMVDEDTEVVVGVELRAGNAGDGDGAAPLLEDVQATDGVEVDTLLGDMAYSDGDVRQAVEDQGAQMTAKVPPVTNGGRLPKTDFSIDMDAGAVTCPAGQTTTDARATKDHKGGPAGDEVRLRRWGLRRLPLAGALHHRHRWPHHRRRRPPRPHRGGPGRPEPAGDQGAAAAALQALGSGPHPPPRRGRRARPSHQRRGRRRHRRPVLHGPRAPQPLRGTPLGDPLERPTPTPPSRQHQPHAGLLRRVRPRGDVRRPGLHRLRRHVDGLPREPLRGRTARAVLAGALDRRGTPARRTSPRHAADGIRKGDHRARQRVPRPTRQRGPTRAAPRRRTQRSGLPPPGTPARLPACVPTRGRRPRPVPSTSDERPGSPALRPLLLPRPHTRPRPAPPRDPPLRPLRIPCSRVRGAGRQRDRRDRRPRPRIVVWSPDACPDLDAASLSNNDLLEAVRHLAYTEQDRALQRVDFANLGPEELGSIYESLLELHPRIELDAARFELFAVAGNERKSTGSYYTPTSLIAALLDKALDPLLDEAEGSPDPQAAILSINVLDPACGSGHFLTAAARRIAARLASVENGELNPTPEAIRHSLRQVVGRCVYGIDLNPMAAELAKVNLWLDAVEPGLPLSFLDHHVVCGNGLIGTNPRLIAEGIPDEAFKAIEGDDKPTAAARKKTNAAERRQRNQGLLALGDSALSTAGYLADAVRAIDAEDDTTLDGIQRKQQRWAQLQAARETQLAKLVADTWCAAFFAPKTPENAAITDQTLRAIAGDRTGTCLAPSGAAASVAT